MFCLVFFVGNSLKARRVSFICETSYIQVSNFKTSSGLDIVECLIAEINLNVTSTEQQYELGQNRHAEEAYRDLHSLAEGIRELFFLRSKLKNDNCEHVIVQRVALLFFPVTFQQTIPNKPNQHCRNYVRNISGTFQETIVQGICQKKG